jgi:hypothetical protein
MSIGCVVDVLKETAASIFRFTICTGPDKVLVPSPYSKGPTDCLHI